MQQPKATFSESWHRVAQQRIRLRPGVEIQRQFFRGERWFVVQNRFSNEFFRLTPAAYQLLLRLENRTVEDAWQQTIKADPEGAPTQDEVIGLLAQLYQANLLRSELAANTAELFERYQRRQRRELQSRFNLIAIQIPVWDPDPFLRRTLPLVRPLLSWAGAAVWILVVGFALKLAADHWPALRNQTEGVLAPANLPLLYVALFFIKLLHELGHAYACRRFGGEVHRMGVMLLFFSPVPFVDATSSWAFRDRWKRIFVAAAGMIVELFIAAIALFAWSQTSPGPLHSLAYNVIFIASVTTVLFNANPLLRYDGYYILADLLEIPNLAARAQAQLQYVIERYLFGVREQTSPAATRREAAILVTYGAASWIYRVILFAGIILFLAEHYLLLGLILAAVSFVTWAILPIVKAIRYLLTSPRIVRQRGRALAVSAAFAGIVLILLGAVPVPNHFRATGVVKAERYSELFSAASGYLETFNVQSGQFVHQGDSLLVLRNRELELDLTAAEGEAAACRAALEQTLDRGIAGLAALQDRLTSLEKQIANLKEQRAALVVRAPHDGILAAPKLRHMIGTWIPRGSDVGKLIAPGDFQFSAVIPQTEADNLFTRAIRRADVRLLSDPGRTLAVRAQKIVPAQREELPSPALGWTAGGEVPVTPSDPRGLRAAEPFFEVRATLENSPADLVRHGCSGRIRFTLQPEPLLQQWARTLRQTLQRRFQL